MHWTRHSSRLDRSFGRKAWGDAGYAQEELVAELGAAFLAADLGLSLEPREEHAAYISHWLKGLKNVRGTSSRQRPMRSVPSIISTHFKLNEQVYRLDQNQLRLRLWPETRCMKAVCRSL